MKKITLLATSILGIVTLGSTIAQAADVNVDTEGVVNFSNVTEAKPVKPDDDSGTVIEPGDKPGGGSDTSDMNLKLLYVPNFVFADNGNTSIKYDFMKGNKLEAIVQTTKEAGEFPNFAQVYHSKEVANWLLAAKASDFKLVGGTKILDGAKIVLDDADAVKNVGSSTVATATIENSLITLESNEKVNIGKYVGTTNESAINSFNFNKVKLDITSGLAIGENETYKSNITWTLSGDATAVVTDTEEE
ncbi:WxL domain-containing protein [Vagococcus sp.]|uniref:WxL domain-containing protein n=1 Tax=Vagococcus sp. TaxID=1933889 RepID=UPI003F99CF26